MLRSVLRFFLAANILLLLAVVHPAWAETVRLPITVDYPLLRSIMIDRLFAGPGGTAVALDEHDGCLRIVLWDPDVGPEGDLVRLGAKVMVRAGAPVGGQCLSPLIWVGYVEVIQRVWLDDKYWRLCFENVDLRLYDLERRQTVADEFAQSFIQTHLTKMLNKVSVDVTPPIKVLKETMPLLFSPERGKRIQEALATLRPGRVWVTPEGIKADLLMDIDLPPAAPAETGERVLSEQELEQFVKLWQSWDAFLVLQIKTLGIQPLTDEERLVILETLIETRQRFVRVLTTRVSGPDEVRDQFVIAWRRLAPILRRHLGRDPSGSPLGYLTFFTASDTLAVLDKLGPALGIEISRDGLLRLARMLVEEGEEPTLDYSWAVDARLRSTLGLGPPLKETGPAFEGEEIDLDSPLALNSLLRPLADWLARPALADSDQSLPSVSELKKWIAPKSAPGPYLDRVRELLEEEAAWAIERAKLPAHYHGLYRLLVPATAWQESCWRQFVVQGGKIKYLRSYNKTSVGLMQINERVWRGIYRPESLRWDVRYNAKAGCEIIALYLNRYALPRLATANPIDGETLARAVYAMYNGGPSQFKTFLDRHHLKKYWQSDELFLEKFLWTAEGQWEKVCLCLIGR